MGYAAIAEPIEDLRPLVRFYLEVSGSSGNGNYPAPLLRAACGSVEGQRALGATIQLEFENFVEERVKALLEHVGQHQVRFPKFSMCQALCNSAGASFGQKNPLRG